MSDRNFTVSFTVAETPEAVFAAINNPRGWWSEEIEGAADGIGSVFWYHFRDLHRCTMKVSEFSAGKKVGWHVLDKMFSFTKDKTEWTGTDITFEIARTGSNTELRFTHRDLTPEHECYDACAQGWSTYVKKSLRDLIETGKGHPNVGEPVTEMEKALVG